MEIRRRIRKVASMVVLVVFLSSNLLDPFYYAFAEENLFVVENEIEVMEDETEVNDDETEEEIVVDEVNTDVSNEEDVDEVVVEEPVNHEITGDDDPEGNTGDTEPEPGTNTGNTEPEPGTNIDLWEEGEDFNDIVYTGTVRGVEYTVTLMDRNLGATTTDREDEDSYGYYYQWGNSYPFSHHLNLNQYSATRVDASGYGPDNRYRGENFIKGSNDWSTVSNDNLWGGEGDNDENDYWDIEAERQGPCPDGYHVPSVGEWYALLSSFLVNNGLDEKSTDGLSYSDYIGKERQAAYYLDSEYIENFKETFNITYAGRIKTNATMDRMGSGAHLWTSTPLNKTALGFEVWDDRINLGGWETTRATAYPIRCFKSVEYEWVDYTITYIDGENETTETRHRGDTLTEPTHTDRGTGYDWLGWYIEGEDKVYDFSTPITGDITLVATWKCAENYHEENDEGEALSCKPNKKTVECEQTGGVANSTYVVTGVEIAWDVEGERRSEIPVCEWECMENYHEEEEEEKVKCESNKKRVECIQTGKVEHSTYEVTGVVIERDFTGGKWNEIPVCEWKCDNHYHTGDDNNSCEIDTFQFTLVENSQVNTSGSTASGKKPYNSTVELNAQSYTGYRFLGWQIIGLNGTGISTTSVNNQVVFNMPDREVTATPLSEIIEYEIIYNLNGGINNTNNPDTYTIETETFTLSEPVKTGYTFLGWTGSNGLEPEKNITLTKGNYGDKKYNAVWEPKSGIEYTVIHALEKANENSYEERETEILSGTTDEMTQAVAKEYTGFTARDITQKVIKGDGSTVVRVQYNRNIYTITFDSNSGSEVKSITGKYESNLTAPTNPTRAGYRFVGWEPSFPETMPLGGAGLVAQWKKKSSGGSSSSSEETPTPEVTTGDVNTGTVITGEKLEELVDEVENLDIDAGTSIAPMVMRSMSLGSTMLEAISPIEINEELEEARETLNKNKIKGKETYNNITINVEAPKNSFPDKVQLRIVPITGAEQKQSIKEQLMENGNVTTGSELVSFDVSFVYVTSDGEEIEVQPAEGQKVKVTFNYKNNNKFNKAKKEKDKELKVYHFEKVKNRRGKDTGKVEIKEVEINGIESIDGELVIDAENFSIYTIVDQIREETNNQLAEFKYGVITISGSDASKCLTIMDRNLGATSNDINNSDSYGYYYQYGNNYGFTEAAAQANNSSTPVNTQQTASNYYSKTFIKQQQWYTYNDNYDGNLWGGGSDYKNQNSLKTTASTNYSNRQGPCPDGWHVPSAQEWVDLLKYFEIKNPTATLTKTSNGFAYFQQLNNGILFQQWAKLPNAGLLLETNAKLSVNVGTEGRYWNSSTFVKKGATSIINPLKIGANYVGLHQENNAYFQGRAMPVRCFYNSTSCSDIPEPTISDGEECETAWGATIADGQSVTGYQSATVPYGQSCVGVSATCNDGNWSVENFTGIYLYSGCSVAEPATCSFQGQTIAHNGSLAVYSSASPTCPTACTQGTVTCNNGTLGGNTGYTNLSCIPLATTCDEGFTLNSTGANGIYSGCTTYTVNGNSCNAGTTKYKLTNCANGYHTENNSTCISNSKQVACAQTGKPDNSSYITGNVTVNWQGTWNSGNWSATGNCEWVCDTHYHTGANNNSCEIDQFLIRWIDGNGQTLKTDTVNYNVVPTYTGPTPTKTATAQYSYTFNDTWSPTPVVATTGATYMAQFNQTVNHYNVIFDANGGTPTPATQSIEYGQTATRPADPINSGYALVSWQLSGSNFDFSTPITGAINLVAQWRDAIPPTCTITQAACTSGALQLTLTGSEALQTPTGWTKVNDMKYTLNVTSNDQVTANIMDIAGNTGSCSITPTNYDAIGPGVPTLTTPVNNAYINEEYPYFAWTPGNMSGCATFSSYEFQGCYDSGCSNVILTVTGITNTGGTIFSIGVSAEDGTYYWRVREKDSLSKYSDWTSTNKIIVDSTKPTCIITQSPTTPTNGNVILTATITETNKDKYSWTGWSDMATTQTTWTLSGNGSKTFYMQDKAGNTGSCSITVNTIDREGPTGTLSTTSTLKTGTQRLTGTCTDTVGVTAYYLGTNSSPLASDYKTVTSATSYTTGMNVTDAGTYYLYCKDVAGNVSTGASQTYYSYTVQNMLDTLAGTQGTYNTTNYAANGSLQGTYIVTSGTTIALNSGILYEDPIQGKDFYAGWTTANSGIPTYANPTITANSDYYRWFNRTYYDLELVAGIGISEVSLSSGLPAGYTRVEYIQSNGSQYIDTLVPAKSGISSDITFSFVSIPSDASVLAARKSGDRLYLLHYYRGFTYGYGNYYNNGGSASENVIYNVKTILNAGSQSMIVDGVTKMNHNISDTKNLDLNLYLFAANNGGSMTYPSSIKLYKLKIYDENNLIRYFVPCVRNNDNVAGLYDLVSGTFYPSATSAQFTGGPEVTGKGVYKYGDTPSISASVKTGYTWTGWTKNTGDSPENAASQSTTLALTQDTTLTANATLNTYTITYNLNGGAEAVANPTTYTTESESIIVQQPTKTGYIFLGWTGSNGDIPQTGVIILSGSYGDQVYNAAWQAIEYNVTFDANGGLPTPATQSIEYGQTATKPTDPINTGYVLASWQLSGSDFDFSTPIIGNTNLVAHWEKDKRIILEATSTAANQTLKINKYFANAYTVDWGDGSPVETVSADKTHTYSTAGTYTIKLSLLGADRWTFNGVRKPLVPTNGTTMTGVKIVSMPSLADGFGSNATSVGNSFFYYFNYNGKLTSLPSGSFDISNITTVGNGFFSNFNYNGQLTSLPEGSFRLSTGLTTVGYYFFSNFNYNGQLTSLPDGSFNTENITSVEDYFFSKFNYNGQLTSLPSGSFDTSKITTVGSDFFSYFNGYGKLTSLPSGSFDTSNITTVGDKFFTYFNSKGQLTSLPEGSFDTSKITTVGYDFFSFFNSYGQLTSLPEGSFRLSTGLTTVGSDFFEYFNGNGQLTSLPSGSFDTSKITTVGNDFFEYFNGNGQLTSLPEGSFDTSKITTVGSDFFSYFNDNGTLTSLPEGSFDTSKITTVGDYFFSNFNGNGQLTSLPEGSFDTSKITTVGSDFFSYFNDNGALTSLPEGSFDTSKITTVGDYFFSYFNGDGQLTSLPEGSFDTSKITTVGSYFFSNFNYNGKLTSLPDSFTINSTGASKSDGYQDAFNSPNYTLNRKVSDLVSGVTTPSSDMDVFSDNQPGRCGVADNWLVTPAGTCDLTVTFNVNGGVEIEVEIAGTGDKIILPSTTKMGYVLDGWYDELSGGNKIGDAGDPFTVSSSQTLYAQWVPTKDIILEATSTEANQTLKINKYFANAYTVDWGDGTTGNLTADTTHTYSTPGTYTITLSLAGGADRWTFKSNYYYPLIPTNLTTMRDVKVIYMPSLADGFGTNATNPGNSFFSYFNNGGKIVALPVGSFDTSNITIAGNYFFSSFNDEGQLTSLPAGSFNISNITKVGNYFFESFNDGGQLRSLPAGSFNISNITTVGNNFFRNFNYRGQLTSLPAGSFRLSTGLTTVGVSFFSDFNGGSINLDGKLTSLPDGSFNTENITKVGNSFFAGFNSKGKLTSLPVNSFDISNITTVGNSFFSAFNSNNGKLTSLPAGSFRLSTGLTTVGNEFFYSFNGTYGKLMSLPDGSFDISNITKVGYSFFASFNYQGALTSLPAGSFRFSTGLTTVGDFFFGSFNSYGTLGSLPDGSFDTSNITTAGNYFFRNFNSWGHITSLPEGSFDTSNITSVGNYFFYYFNSNGQLTSLPEGSFDASHITTVGNNFFSNFNQNGAVTYLPDSFKVSSVGASVTGGYQNAFNSPSYTINRKVSDLVSGVTVPLNDMNTFSDNQPGRCGVDANRLVTTADACSISYDDGQGGTGEVKYNADTTGVVVGSGITLPSREGYTFSGWQDASGNIIDEVIFPDMDGETLYAIRYEETYTITYNLNGGTETQSNPTIYTVKSGAITLAALTKTGYTFLGWTGSNGDIPQTGVIIPTGSTGDRIYNAVWQTNTYNISYTMNGGTQGSNHPVNATYDTSFIVDNPTKVGYTFSGWKITGMDEGVTHYYGDQTTTSTNISSTTATGFNNLTSVSGDTVNFEALWTINQYTATILAEPSGYGTVSPTSVNEDYNSNITISGNTITIGGTTVTAKPATTTAQYGYTFSGWVNNCGDKLTGDCTITAQFDRILRSYRIRVTATPEEWAESIYGSGIYNYGDPLTVNVHPTVGHNVIYYSINGEGNEYITECGKGLSITFKGGVVGNRLIAYTLGSCEYEVVFNGNGGTGSMDIQRLTYDDEPIALYENLFTRTGYTFTGWSKTSTGEVLYRDQELVRNILDTGATVSLYAVWELDNYTITYNLNGGTNNANNPSTYTVESGDITLQSPTRVGYTFLGWTGSNGDTPQTGVVIPTGSTGERIYNAVWQANTNTQYIVYHYVKPVGSSIYELAETQTGHGTTDSTLVFSGLAKTGFVCVHYRRGSLTGTEAGPGEIVVQTTIKGDGSTKIYLYYDRDSHIVHLSGDEHVEYLKINGELYDESEAVRECGSEVPVEAIPKPGYHFVRWDRDIEREEREGENENG